MGLLYDTLMKIQNLKQQEDEWKKSDLSDEEEDQNGWRTSRQDILGSLVIHSDSQKS